MVPWTPVGMREGCIGRLCSTWSWPCSPGRPQRGPSSRTACTSCPTPASLKQMEMKCASCAEGYGPYFVARKSRQCQFFLFSRVLGLLRGGRRSVFNQFCQGRLDNKSRGWMKGRGRLSLGGRVGFKEVLRLVMIRGREGDLGQGS